MADDGSNTFRARQTGLIVKVPEAEPAVRGWRERLDPSARAGLPAHITVLYPFLDESRIDSLIRSDLREALKGHRAFDMRFDRCGPCPGVLYLAPEPDTHLRQLTQTIVDRWPETPPFGGQFADVIPHLTVGQSREDDVLEETEAGLLGSLPITAHVSSVELMVHDGTMWHERASFALQ